MAAGAISPVLTCATLKDIFLGAEEESATLLHIHRITAVFVQRAEGVENEILLAIRYRAYEQIVFPVKERESGLCKSIEQALETAGFRADQLTELLRQAHSAPESIEGTTEERSDLHAIAKRIHTIGEQLVELINTSSERIPSPSDADVAPADVDVSKEARLALYQTYLSKIETQFQSADVPSDISVEIETQQRMYHERFEE